MKFGQPLLTTELSGSIGGVTASSARGSVNYFRVRRVPSNPRSPAQTAVRVILTAIAAAWAASLSISQRAAWALIAPPEASGIDAYVEGNARAMQGGQARVDTAPATASLTIAPLIADPVPKVTGALILLTIPSANQGIARFSVYASSPQPVSQLSRSTGYRYLGTTATNVAGTISMSVPSSHPAFGMVAGQIVYISVRAFGDVFNAAQLGKTAVAQNFRATVIT